MSLNEAHAREAICAVGASLFARGYVHATAGNISVRVDDGILITPTDACLGQLDPARLAKLDANGVQVSGDKASKTWRLHQAIYQAACVADPQTACVIHTHSRHCVAWSLRQPLATVEGQGVAPDFLPPLTPYFVMKVGHVPHLAYQRPGDPVVADRVAQAIAHHQRLGHPIRAVMLNRLGPNVWHANPSLAMAVLEELEETAQLALLQPEAMPLAETQIQSLREHFAARW